MGGKIPRQFILAIDKGVQNTMLEGVLAGYPMVDVKVAVFDGSMHAVDSNEMAFRMAARIGFRAAAEKADMVLLEPVATLTIDVPEEYSGAVMGDMSSRRGRILGMEMVDGMQRIHAQAVPYAEVVHYSPHPALVTHGTGTYSIEIGEYAEVPFDMAKKVIEQYQKEQGRGPLAPIARMKRRRAGTETEPALLLGIDGARDRIRTCDLLLRRQTLYPLGYAGVIGREAEHALYHTLARRRDCCGTEVLDGARTYARDRQSRSSAR